MNMHDFALVINTLSQKSLYIRQLQSISASCLSPAV